MRDEECRSRGDELEAWRLLPWLSNGTLQGDELEEVLAHLQKSPSAREELLFLSELRHAVDVAAGDEFEPSQGRFEQLMRRIEDHEAGRSHDGSVEGQDVAVGGAAIGRGIEDAGVAASSDLSSAVAAAEVGEAPRGRIDSADAGRPVAVFEQPSRVRRWTAWGAVAAAVLLFVALFSIRGPGSGRSPASSAGPSADFRTLSEDVDLRSDPDTGREGSRIRVVFEGGTEERTIRALLLELEMEIVAGPSSSGVYSLQSTALSGAPRSFTDTVSRLRQDLHVAFAEVVIDD